MKRSSVLLAAAGLLLAHPALANDTMATLGAGGLVFVQSQDVTMQSEDLYVSPDQVKVRYEFRNDGQKDAKTMVAFPLPDITGDGDFMVAVPSEDQQNIFGFQTTFDGKPVEAELHQYVFAENIEYTDYLKGLGIPLLPYGDATTQALGKLDDATRQELMHRGLVLPMEYSDALGPDGKEIWKTDYIPVWTLRSTYSWEADFPVGKTVVVEHQYKPSVGGTVAVTFMGEAYEGYDPLAEARKKYCVDDNLVAAIKKSLADPQDPNSAPYYEQWIQYVWSTGANWSGPIGKFRLVVDKGDPKNLVSFCWDGPVTKIGETQFEATATDFYPPYDRELEIMLLHHQDPVPEAPATTPAAASH